MTSYRTILVAAVVALSATSAYAGSGRADTELRDEGLGINHNVMAPTMIPQGGVIENRTSQGALFAPYATGQLFHRREAVSPTQPTRPSW